MAVINRVAKLILLFCKFEHTCENPTALEARENLETLSVTQHGLVLIR